MDEAVSVDWLDQEKRIILWRFSAGGTIDAMMESFRKFRSMVENIEGRTYTIVDFTQSGAVPNNILTYFPEMARMLPSGEKQSAIIAVVSKKRFLNGLMEIFGKVYNERYVFFETVEQARAHIEAKINASIA